MPTPIIKFDEKKLLKKMEQYERVTGKEVTQQIRNFSRMLGIELMRQSRPFWVKSPNESKEKTERAVLKDMHQYLIVLNQASQDAWAEAKTAKRSLYRKDGTEWLTDEYRMATTAKEVKEWYNKMRSPSTGRPPRRGDKTIGRHTAATFLVIPQSILKKVKAEILRAVGKTRAGWAKAAQDCKADTKAAAKLSGIPAWVKRHLPKSSGNAVEMDKSFFGSRNSKHFRVIMRSGVPYASRLMPQKVIRDTANIVRGRMAKFISRTISAELRKVKSA
jgi:hypothetical protein